MRFFPTAVMAIIGLCVLASCTKEDEHSWLSSPPPDIQPHRYAFYVMGDTHGISWGWNGLLHKPKERDVPFAIGSIGRPGITPKIQELLGSYVERYSWFAAPDENNHAPTYHRMAEWDASCQDMKQKALERTENGDTIDLYGHSRGGAVIIHCAPELAALGRKIGIVALIDGGDTTSSMRALFDRKGRPAFQKAYAEYLALVKADDPYYNGRFDQTVALAGSIMAFKSTKGEYWNDAVVAAFANDPRVDHFVLIRGTHNGIRDEAVGRAIMLADF